MAKLEEIYGSGRWSSITPSDTVNLLERPRAIYVGVSGDITALDTTGLSSTFKSVPIGEWHIHPTRVMATGTTATNLIAMF